MVDCDNVSDLNSPTSLMIAGEYIFFLLVIITVFALFATHKISTGLFLLFWSGFLLGACWEVTHAVLGDSFLRLKNPEVNCFIPRWIYPILHSVSDAVLMCVGLGIAYGFSRLIWGNWDKAYKKITNFNIFVLFIMLVWGVGQEIVVELLFNNKFWYYVPNDGNPTLFTLNGTNYTVVPIMEWLVASIVFWVLTSVILKKYETRKGYSSF